MTIPVLDGAGNSGKSVLEASELTALLTAIPTAVVALQAIITSAGNTLPAGAATDAKSEAIRALLAAPLTVTNPSPVLAAGAASTALQTAGNTQLAAIVTALAGTLVTAPIAAKLPQGTDRGGSITTASTAQQVAAANMNRVGMTFQNTSDTAMRLTESGTAATATTGYLVAAGQAVNVSTQNAISVFCAAAGKTFAATEY